MSLKDALNELQGSLTERQALKKISAEDAGEDSSVEEVEFDDGGASYAAEVTDRSQRALINKHRTAVGEIVTCALCKDTGALGVDCKPEDIRGVMIGPAYVQQRKQNDNPKFVHLNCALFSPEVRIDPPPTWTVTTPETRNMLWGVYHATSSVCHVHDHHVMGLHVKHLRPVINRLKKKCCVCGKPGAFTGCALEFCSRAFHLKCAFERGAQLFAGSTWLDTDEHMRSILCWEHLLPEFKSPTPDSKMVDLAHTVNVDKMNDDEFDRLEAYLGLEVPAVGRAEMESASEKSEHSESESETKGTHVRSRAKEAERQSRQPVSSLREEMKIEPSPKSRERSPPEANNFEPEEEDEEEEDWSYASSEEPLLDEIAKKPRAARNLTRVPTKARKQQPKEQQHESTTSPSDTTLPLTPAEPKPPRIPRKLSQSSRKIESDSEDEEDKRHSVQQQAKPVLPPRQAKPSPPVPVPVPVPVRKSADAVADAKTLQKPKRKARKSEQASHNAAAAPANLGHVPLNAVSVNAEPSTASSAATAATPSYAPISVPLQFFPSTAIVKTAKSEIVCTIEARCLPQQIPWPAEVLADKVAPFDDNFKAALAAQLEVNEVMLAEILSDKLLQMFDQHRQLMQTKFMTNDEKSLAIVAMDTDVGAELASFLKTHGMTVPRRVEIALLYTAQAFKASPMMALMNPMAMMQMAQQPGNPLQFMPPAMSQQQPPVPMQPQPPIQQMPGSGGVPPPNAPFQPSFMPAMVGPSPAGVPPMSFAQQPPQQPPQQQPPQQQPQQTPFAFPPPHMQGASGVAVEPMSQHQQMHWGRLPATTNGHATRSERKSPSDLRDDGSNDRRDNRRERSRSRSGRRSSSPARRGKGRRSYSHSRSRSRTRSRSGSRSSSRSRPRRRSRSPRRPDRSDRYRDDGRRDRDKQHRDKGVWRRHGGGGQNKQEEKAQGSVYMNTKKVSNLNKIQPPAPPAKASSADPLLSWS